MKNADQIPPGWMSRLFVWLCKPADVDDLLGDMEEMYRQNLQTVSRFKVRYKYLLQCMALVFSYTVKKRKSQAAFLQHKWSIQNSMSMYFNYLKMVLRRLRRQRIFSFINILGLGVGLASCFIILLFIKSERSYDKFHEDHERIFRLTKTYPVASETVETAELRGYFLPIMQESNPDIEAYCRIKDLPEGLMVKTNEAITTEKRVAFAEENFFSFFSFRLINGDAQRVLAEPYSVVISQSIAARYFGSDSPLGEVLNVSLPQDGRELSLKVTGVFENMPLNSHLHKDLLISAQTGMAEQQQDRGFRGFVMQHNYFKLVKGRSIDSVVNQLPEIEEKHAPGFYKRHGMHLNTQRMTDIHLHSQMEREFEANGSARYLDLLGVLAVFMLIMAAFNYMNLATAQSLDRSKEVGVRKVIGSGRTQLVGRFISEAVIIALTGLLLATILVAMVLPYFNQLSGQQLHFDIAQHWTFIPLFLGLTVLLGFIAGMYPALYMSGFGVIESLKGKLSGSGSTTRNLRKGLVVVQFAISAALMCATGIVFKQFNYMLNRDLGMNTSSVVAIDISAREMAGSYRELKQALLTLPEVQAVSASAKTPVTSFDLRATNGIILPGTADEISMNYLLVDKDFFSLYQIPFLLGQGYDTFQGTHLNGIVINRTAMQRLGFTEQNVLGQRISVYDGYHPEIIGVIEDFHFESLHQEIGPVYFQWAKDSPDRFEVMSLRIADGSLSNSVTAVQEVYEIFAQMSTFDFYFLSDRIARAYQSEKYFVRTFGLFTLLAVVMACLGALGLAMQLATTRRKEVGVRKVLGASVKDISVLLTKDLILMVLLANLIAWPLAYWAMGDWLQSFAYRQPVSWTVFLAVLGTSITIAILSTGTTALKTALTNPGSSLRSE